MYSLLSHISNYDNDNFCSFFIFSTSMASHDGYDRTVSRTSLYYRCSSVRIKGFVLLLYTERLSYLKRRRRILCRLTHTKLCKVLCFDTSELMRQRLPRSKQFCQVSLAINIKVMKKTQSGVVCLRISTTIQVCLCLGYDCLFEKQ